MMVVSVLDLINKPPLTDEARLRLQKAYVALVAGHPSKDDCQAVLVDLAMTSGYYNTTAAEMPAEQVKYNEGMRAVYGRIVRFASMTLTEIEGYQKAIAELQQFGGDQI